MSSSNSGCSVEVLYNYESRTANRGHSVVVQPGEKYLLVSDANDDWWYVAKDDGSDDGFYLPRTYVKVLAHTGSLSNTFKPRNSTGEPNARINDGDTYRLLTAPIPSLSTPQPPAVAAPVGDSPASKKDSFRKGPGFWLASNPNRVSRSIPVDLNFATANTSISVDGEPPSDVSENEAVANGVCPLEARHYDQPQPVAAVRRSIEKEGSSSADCTKSSSYDVDSDVEEDGQDDDDDDDSDEEQPVEQPEEDDHHYENLNGTSAAAASAGDGGSNEPPKPADDDCPIRELADDWAEYVEGHTGRAYFHHKMTGYSSWKPPRNLAGPREVSAHMRGVSLDNQERPQSDAEQTDGEQHYAVTPVITQAANENNATVAVVVSSNGSPPYTSVMTSSTDSGLGRTSLSLRNKSYGLTSGKHPPTLPSHKQSMKSADFDVLTASEDAANSIRTEAGRSLKSASFSRIMNSSQKATKSGSLDKCKTMEAGRKLKKQWSTCFVYLTGAHLIFYKDEKASEKRGHHYPAPQGVCDLRGAALKWADPDRKHKHIFQLDLIDGTSYLFSCPDTQDVNSWYHACRVQISRLPQPELYPTPSNAASAIDNEPSSTHKRAVVVSRSVSIAWRRSGSGHEPSTSTNNIRSSSRFTDSHNSSRASKKMTSSSHSSDPSSGSEEKQREERQTILDRLRRFFKSRPTLDSLKEKGIYKPEPVFGSSLTEICRRERDTVPRFIRVCTAIVEQKGIDADGLYRISGNLSSIQKIRCQVDQEKYSLLENESDIHVVTGALKLFFRELQEPVFPLAMIKDFLNAIRIPKAKSRMQKFIELLSRMPPPHHDTLEFLFSHLLRVAAESKQNRMQVHNLAIVFGPTLFSGASEQQQQQRGGSGKAKGGKHKAGASNNNTVDVVQSNSHLAYNMIMQGQIVEYLLKDYAHFFTAPIAVAEQQPLPPAPPTPTTPAASHLEQQRQDRARQSMIAHDVEQHYHNLQHRAAVLPPGGRVSAS